MEVASYDDIPTNRRGSSYRLLLNSIADDLDFLLNDLYKNYPFGSQGQNDGSSKIEHRSSLHQQYAAAGEEEDDNIDDSPVGRKESVLSAHLDIFGLDDEDKGLHIPSHQMTANGVDAAMEKRCNTGDEPRFIPMVERLIKTHSVWYLPMVDRAGAMKLLDGKEDGVFIVRQSSRQDTMALSFRFAAKPGGFDHYLIEFTGGGLRIEGSLHFFPAMPMLIAHYCENLDEIPCQLCLPGAILNANTSKDLKSISLLAKDFWTTSLMKWTKPHHSIVTSLIDIHPYNSSPSSHSISSPVAISNFSKNRITENILLSPSSNYDISDLPESMYQVQQSECLMANLKPTDSSGTGTTSSQNSSSSSHPSMRSDGSMSRAPVPSQSPPVQKLERTNEFQGQSQGQRQQKLGSFVSKTTINIGACDSFDGLYQEDSMIDSGGESDISSDGYTDDRYNGVKDTSTDNDSEIFFKASTPYCKGDFRDRLSDYEDVWTPDKDKKENNFDVEELRTTATKLNKTVELVKVQEEFRNNLNALTRALSLSTGSLSMHSETKSPCILSSPGHIGFMNPGFDSLKKQLSAESLNMNQEATKTTPLIPPYSKQGILNPGFKDSLDRSTINSKSDMEEKVTEVNCTFELPDVSQVTERKRPDKLDVIPMFETKNMAFTSTLNGESNRHENEQIKPSQCVNVSEFKHRVNEVDKQSAPAIPEKPRPPPLNLSAVNVPSDELVAKIRKYSSPPYAEPVDAISPDMRVPMSPDRCPASTNKLPAHSKRRPVSSSAGPLRASHTLSMHDEHGQLHQDFRPKNQNEAKPVVKGEKMALSADSKQGPPIPPRIGWVRRRKSAPNFPLNMNVRKLLSGKGTDKGDSGKEHVLTVSQPLGRPPLGNKPNQRTVGKEDPLSKSEPHGSLFTNSGALEFSNASNEHIKLHRLSGYGGAVQSGDRVRFSSPLFALHNEKPRPFPVSKEEVVLTKSVSLGSGLQRSPPRARSQVELGKGRLEKQDSMTDIPENGEEIQSPEMTKKEKPQRRHRILRRPLSLKVEKTIPQYNKKETKWSSFSSKGKPSPLIIERLPIPLNQSAQDQNPKGSKSSLGLKRDKSVESLEGSKSSFGPPCSIFGCQTTLDPERPISVASSFKSFSSTDLSHNDQKGVPDCAKNTRHSADHDDSTLSIISDRTSFSDTSTVEDLIRACSPQLTINPVCQLTMENVHRLSAYDNLHCIDELQSPGESIGTVFCKPWDSTVWENLLTEEGDGLNLPSEVTEAVQEWIKRSGSMSDVAYTPAPFSSNAGTASVADSWTYQGADISEPPTPQNNKNPPGLTPVPGSPNHANRLSTHELQNRSSNQEPSSLPRLPISQTSSMRSTPDQNSDTASLKKIERNSRGIDIVSPNVHVHEETGNDSWVNISFDDRRPSFAMEAVEDMCLSSQSPQQQRVLQDDEKSDVSESFRNKIMPYLGARKVYSLRSREKDPGLRIRDSISRLAMDKNTTFGCTIENFNQCTIESAEMNPNIVMRNVRQFMSGIKNYLTKHGEGQLQDIIERERNKLHEDEFLNIDAIIEGSLHKCVIKPLKQHLYSLFVRHHTKNGNLELLSSSIKLARTKTPVEIGLRPGLIPPRGTKLEEIKHYLEKMQKAYSPLKKLENLLGATSAIYNGVEEQGANNKGCSVTMGADDFLPVFIYVIVQCGLISAEIEADYMWGLLHPSLLAGEGGYYLTTLSSAVHVLKNFTEEEIGLVSMRKVSRCSSMNDGNMQGVMKILIPDEKDDTIRSQPLPVRPNMTSKDVCSLIAHKFRVTNPQDYGLYTLVDKAEIKLQDSECPQVVMSDYAAVGIECRFAYKRNDAAFAWPRMTPSPSPGPLSNAGYSHNKHSASLSHIREGME